MPPKTDPHKTLSAQEARQGKELGTVRHVLWISVVLAIIAGVLIYVMIRG